MALLQRQRKNAFYDEVFRNETVRVDGNRYEDCTFYNCKLEFAATALPIFHRCRFANSDWFFVDAAANMIAFLSQLPKDFGTPGKELFKNLFRELEESRITPPDSPVLITEAKSVAAPVSTLVISATPEPARIIHTSAESER